MKKIAIILIIIVVSFSLFAESTESIEDTEDTENCFYFYNTLISENDEVYFTPRIGYYFNDGAGETFTFSYSPAGTYTINQENEESFCDYLMKGKELSLTGTIPLIYDETTSDSFLFITPKMHVSLNDFSFSLSNSLKLQGYLPSKKEGFVIETEVEDYYSLDTIFRGKRLNFFTKYESQNASNNSSNHTAEIQLGHDLGGNFSDNWLYENSIISNFAFFHQQSINYNEEESISKYNYYNIADDFNIIYDSKENYSITLTTDFYLTIDGEDFSTFFDSKRFVLFTDLDYKQKIDALTYELIGSFQMNNSWILNNNNYQNNKDYSLMFDGNLSYEISEGLDILSSCNLMYDPSNNNNFYIALKENLSYEISESLETSILYKITKDFPNEESEILQKLTFEVNAEISDKFSFEANAAWANFEAIKISANLKVNI